MTMNDPNSESVPRRIPMKWFGVFLVFLLVFAALFARLNAGRPPAVQLVPVAAGFVQPVGLAHAGDGSGRLFVIEKAGVIRIVRDGEVAPEPFLDIRSQVATKGERGLLGLAFDPSFATNGLFYVNYTDSSTQTIIARYEVQEGNPDLADPASELVLLTIHQPTGNHNGGQLAFGPDGYLYIGVGDGGHASSSEHGQDRGVLLGKVLRIDVRDGAAYTVPPDNPFADADGVRPEIWAYGLRNPWRFSFDRETGDLYLPDLGQLLWEEVNFLPAGSPGGENFGWDRMEGLHCYPEDAVCDRAGWVLPVIEYAHEEGNAAVVGGYVYRGETVRGLQGWYVFGDFASGRIWAAGERDHWRMHELLDTELVISSFGEDEQGEVYVLDFVGGGVYRLRR